MEMIEILEHGTTAKIEMEDGASSILVNSDSTDFFLAGQKSQKIETVALKIALREFIKEIQMLNSILKNSLIRNYGK